jgi:hypothetical protein
LKTFEVRDFTAMDDSRSWGVLKVLHLSEDARDPGRAEGRTKREIRAMSEEIHPSLIKLLDLYLGSKWYVSKYYPRDSLWTIPRSSKVTTWCSPGLSALG